MSCLRVRCIGVCMADPAIEPPVMVINTVLSVMAYNYPPEKLECLHLSDDAGSELTFYALLEAFASLGDYTRTWQTELALAKAGTVSDQAKIRYKVFQMGFIHPRKTMLLFCRPSSSITSSRAMNALLRVSSEISNGPVILNVDCDMYSNNSNSIQDALCFFMDEERSHEIAFVQFPQSSKIALSEIYGSLEYLMRLNSMVWMVLEALCILELAAFIGETPFMVEFSKEARIDLKSSCREDGRMRCTSWKKDLRKISKFHIGLKYGCPVEDVLCGVDNSSVKILVQHKRWSEGDLMILLSKYSPVRSVFSIVPSSSTQRNFPVSPGLQQMVPAILLTYVGGTNT
ncbi:hypothetical protein HAX54_030509 [Datura stramonium]|uniref:Uncharacterized protein n=1 Tax=Datura stramonium TaxID=4076 RepID=A0ABS8SB46_DATST|nr:hypothetical protein [Datura stramonium]